MRLTVAPATAETRVADESFHTKQDLVARLADKYGYSEQKVRFLDMERSSVHLRNPPPGMVPPELQRKFKHATLVLQGDGYTFTTNETTAVPNDYGIVTPYEITVQVGPEHVVDLTYDGVSVTDFQVLRLIEIMGKPSTFYFSFKDKKTGKPLPTYLIVLMFR